MFAQQGSFFLQSFQALWYGIMSWLPYALFVLVIFIIGVVIATYIGKALAHLINLTKIDKIFEGTSFQHVVRRSGYDVRIGAFIGWVVKWFLILGFLAWGLESLGLSTATLFLQQIVVVFLPRVVVAVLILIFGSVLAEFIGKLVSGSARIANVVSSSFAGTVARWAIWIMTILFALNQLGIGSDLIQTLWTGIVVALALSFGLSFGLGGREHASQVLDRVSMMISRHDHK